MNDARKQEIDSLLERAEESLRAAKKLLHDDFFDFAASRAYYAVFYASSAVLLDLDISFKKHSAVIASIHQNLIKMGKIDKKYGKELNWLFELRGIGDYGITTHIPREDSEKAVETAEEILNAMRRLL